MFTFIEVHKIDPDYRWFELQAADEAATDAIVVRVVIDEAPRMAADFLERYQAKRNRTFNVAHAQSIRIEELCQEAAMAQVLARKGEFEHDLVELLPTTVIHFDYPERTSFRKSRPARVQMFLDEAETKMRRGRFEEAFQRLVWVHVLDPHNILAFGLKIVCLRSNTKMAECVPVFEAWVAAHPDQEEPRLGLGEMWLHLEQFTRARETFDALLRRVPRNASGLLGLAQAKLKLGEDPLPELRKAHLIDGRLTHEIVERDFDFRRRNPEHLEPLSLKDIAAASRIPLRRLIQRARLGVLPAHPPGEEDDGLLRFNDQDLALYVRVLQVLGLEMNPGLDMDTNQTQTPAEPDEDVQVRQVGLFDELEES